MSASTKAAASDRGYFPVESSTACLLKWGWSSLYLYTGRTNSCHRTTLSTLASGELARFHNTAEKQAHRALMRDGIWPGEGSGCEYCRDIEHTGGVSDRVRNLEMIGTDPDHAARVPRELFDDPTALEVVPTMLEVYFSNLCNMSCLYCGPEYSSQWVSENRLFGKPAHHFNRLDHADTHALNRAYPGRLKEFWQWLAENHGSLRLLNVLGGEPFYQAETQQMIDFLRDHSCPELNLKIFSNLKIERERLGSLFEQMRALHRSGNCRSVGIVASLDCWGPAQEYVRWGLDLAAWEQNFRYVATEHPWAEISINCTLNALSIKAMPALLERLPDWEAERVAANAGVPVPKLNIVFNKLCGPPFMDAAIFPQGFFDADFDRVVALLPKRNDWEQGNVQYLKGIWSAINSAAHDPQAIQELRVYLDEMDRRHHTDWRATFPWLVAT